MKNIYFGFAFLILCLSFLQCESSNDDSQIPTCIQNKIEQLIKNEVQNPPAQVWEWKIKDKKYFYITSDCCDQFNILYDSNCNIVCAPDGGITGNGDGKCPDFTSTIEKTLIWEDSRK